MFNLYQFKGQNPGRSLLVLGAVHGDETCGAHAAYQVIRALHRGHITIENGTLTIVPIVNLPARRARKRYIDRNLNRDMHWRNQLNAVEDEIGNRITELIDDHDALLDLHSYSAPSFGEGSTPFSLVGCKDFSVGQHRDYRFADEIDYARSLNVGIIIHNWLKAYAGRGDHTGASLGFTNGVGTAEYARQKGKIAVTLECGQHRDSQAVFVGKQAIMRALSHFDLLQFDQKFDQHRELAMISFKQAFLKYAPGDRHARRFCNLEPVVAGESLVVREGGRIEYASMDGIVLLPAPSCPLGAELMYLGANSNPLMPS